ncbi:hypothetical protein SLE2022_241870 [Rubroshorea leprosula]
MIPAPLNDVALFYRPPRPLLFNYYSSFLQNLPTTTCPPSDHLSIHANITAIETLTIKLLFNPPSPSPNFHRERVQAISELPCSLHCAVHLFSSMAPELVQTIAKPVEFAKLATLPNRAYVTFLAGNGDYVKGVVGLAKGLRKVKTAYPLVVAVLPDVPEEHRRILKNQGCIVREIEPIYPPENHTQFAMAYYVINYSKLRMWEFAEYSKMIYLDGDIQVNDNIDHLFDLPDGYFYAVMDCFCEKTWSHTPQYKIGYCQHNSARIR